jgi:uncharacterized membrane-anchored protein
MRLLLQSLMFGFLVTLCLSAVVLATTGKVSSIAFWLIFPGVWSVGVALLPFVGQSDSGGVNVILGILVGSVVNICIYALLFCLVRKATRRDRSNSPADSGA